MLVLLVAVTKIILHRQNAPVGLDVCLSVVSVVCCEIEVSAMS